MTHTERPRDAWITCPAVSWVTCWFQTHQAAHGPSINAPCAREWASTAQAQGGAVKWIDGYVTAWRTTNEEA